VHINQPNAMTEVSNPPKRFADDWLQASDAIDYDDLAALVDALDCLKRDAQQKLSRKKATRAGMAPDRRPVGTGGANQGVRRSSRRIASAPRLASSASLFFAENETESESGDDDYETTPAILCEASSSNRTTATATSQIPFGDPTSPSETPIESVREIEVVQRRHALEQKLPSSMLYRITPDVHEHGEPTYVQPAQVFSGTLAVQTYHPQCNNTQSEIDTLHQAEDLEYSGFQSGAESSHHALFRQPCSDPTEPDVSISPTREMEVENSDGEEIAIHDATTPQFFNDAFEDLYGSPLQHESQTGVEETMAACDKQHLTDQNDTQSFVDDPMFRDYQDLACRSSFRLPHESVEDADGAEIRELLSPLVEGKPLTPRLLHGLIYSLVPSPLRILEVDSSASDGGLSADESLVENFAVILCQSGEISPLLVLGAVERKTLSVLGSCTANLPFLGVLCQMLPEWKTEYIDV
jgi:PAS domain-containing protein